LIRRLPSRKNLVIPVYYAKHCKMPVMLFGDFQREENERCLFKTENLSLPLPFEKNVFRFHRTMSLMCCAKLKYTISCRLQDHGHRKECLAATGATAPFVYAYFYPPPTANAS
jgi:hypothetical protein